MSFGFALSDIISVGRLAHQIYSSCKGAPAEFREISCEVKALKVCIKGLEEKACDPDSLLSMVDVSRRSDLKRLLQNCTHVLRRLERLVTQYHSLGAKNKRAWDRLKFGTEGITSIREKLTFHVAIITLFHADLSITSMARMEKKLDHLMAEVIELRQDTVHHHNRDLITNRSLQGVGPVTNTKERTTSPSEQPSQSPKHSQVEPMIGKDEPRSHDLSSQSLQVGL
ncbi:hypothetical protein MMC24_000605 [Lignoscripta atroalba]|nr:hypothetical protein [Lignoscripta atroalba]